MDFSLTSLGPSHRMLQYLRLIRPVLDQVDNLRLIKAQWQAEGMTAAVVAAPKNPDGTLVGLDFKPDLAALNALFVALDNVLTNNAVIVAAIEKVT